MVLVDQLTSFSMRLWTSVATFSAFRAHPCSTTMLATPWVCRSCLRSATRLATAQFFRQASTGSYISPSCSLRR